MCCSSLCVSTEYPAPTSSVLSPISPLCSFINFCFSRLYFYSVFLLQCDSALKLGPSFCPAQPEWERKLTHIFINSHGCTLVHKQNTSMDVRAHTHVRAHMPKLDILVYDAPTRLSVHMRNNFWSFTLKYAAAYNLKKQE